MKKIIIGWLLSVSILVPFLLSHAADSPKRYLIKLDPARTSGMGKAADGIAKAIDASGGKVLHTYEIVPQWLALEVPEQALSEIQHTPGVILIEEDTEVHMAVQDIPWGVNRIGAVLVHHRSKGTGVPVAILDTGIDLDHPDLKVAGNVTFVIGTLNGDDDNGHGTHSAGIVAALDNDIGVVGVAPEAALYAVKVLNSIGIGWRSDVIAGINWSVLHGMKVVSMSLMGSSDTQSYRDACDAAYNSGVLLVAAAANWGNPEGTGDNIGYPAKYGSVIAVGATDINDRRANFSSTGPDLELVAPGAVINSTLPGGGYGIMSGTSIACPHVAGTAALLLADGAMDNIEARHRLQDTARDLGEPGRDNLYGYGLVTANAVDNEEAQFPDRYSLDANTVALYHFDGDFNDASPNGLNLSVSGNAVLASDNTGWMSAPGGQVLRTMGLGDYVSVTIPDNLILPGNNPITVDARIFPREYEAHAITNARVISLLQGWDTMLDVIDGKWNSPAVPHVEIGGQIMVTPGVWQASVPMNGWSHLRLNYYGGENIWDVFVNGTSIGSGSITMNQNRTNNWMLTLGNFSGDIDEVRISNIARGWESLWDPPTNLSASLINGTSVELSWTGVQGATLYNIYRDNSKIGESNTTTYADLNLSPSVMYMYAVSGQFQGGEGPQSLPVEITTPAEVPGGGAYAVDEHTIALYHFNGNFEDAGPNDLHLSAAGGAAIAADGLRGQVLRASNLGDKATVSIPDAFILPGSGSPITIDALFCPRAYLAYAINNFPVISLYQYWDSMLEAIDGKWDNPQAPHVIAGGYSRIIATSGSWDENVPMNEWHHLRITYNTDGMVYVYIDGVVVGSTEVYENGVHVSDDPVTMDISRTQSWILTLGNFDGDIDEVRISNIVRTDASPLGKTGGIFAATETSEADAATRAMNFGLMQNYPNPFNPTTTIVYTVSDVSMVRLAIYNILGQRVRTLVNAVQRQGYYNIVWDGRNDLGSSVATGIYICRIEAGKNIAVRKMVLAK